MSRPLRDGFFDALEVGPELGDFRKLDSEGHGIAGGAETDGYIGVFQGFGEGGDAAEHDALEFLFGEIGGFLAEAGQFFAEAVVLEPAVESAFSDAGGAGGLGEGRSGGDDGQCGLLATGEAGNFSSPLNVSHFLPFMLGVAGRVWQGWYGRLRSVFGTQHITGLSGGWIRQQVRLPVDRVEGGQGEVQGGKCQ